jgi:hypothetical protein
VISFFRSGNPYTILLLVVYTLFIKAYFIFHPALPVAHAADGFLFNVLDERLNSIFHDRAGWFVLLTMLLLLTQALTLNRIVNDARLLPKSTYLPAMSYLLITTFFKEWNVFSAALIVNTVMLWALPLMLALYSKTSARNIVFNIGMIIGIASLVYFPAIIFLLLIWAVLMITRPFRPAEWILAALGLVCPFYFVGTYLFLTGRMKLFLKIPFAGLSYPKLPQEYFALASMALIILLFIFSLFRIQQVYFKMLIQVRKGWMILLAYVIVAVIASFINKAFSINMWIMGMIPFAAFMANAFWNMKRNLVANSVHLLLFGFGIAVQFFTA